MSCTTRVSAIDLTQRVSSRSSGRKLPARRFFAPLQSFAFDDECAVHYALIRADRAAQGKPIGPNDLMIAATARAHDAVPVTRNAAEFSRVAGLHVERS